MSCFISSFRSDVLGMASAVVAYACCCICCSCIGARPAFITKMEIIEMTIILGKPDGFTLITTPFCFFSIFAVR
jgi:hypothetical protein